VLLIGKNGAHDIDEWPRSNILRSGMQENLIISDNQTPDFDAESPLGRVAYSLMSWTTSAKAILHKLAQTPVASV
jgi:hypothetical protein